jgi:hypothetical protein
VLSRIQVSTRIRDASTRGRSLFRVSWVGDVAFERGKGEQIEAVEPDLAVMAFADARVRSFPSSSRLQSGAIGRARCRTVSAGYELNRSTCGRATIVHMSIAAKSRQTPGVAPS